MTVRDVGIGNETQGRNSTRLLKRAYVKKEATFWLPFRHNHS